MNGISDDDGVQAQKTIELFQRKLNVSRSVNQIHWWINRHHTNPRN